jgi:glyoxylase-like metal-dependent hydrolase (beta-lactamase superfamily II)
VDDVLELAERLWRGETDTAQHHPVGHLGGLAEICEGVAFLPSFANVSAFSTEDGLVLVDTGSEPLAPLVHQELRRWTDKRLHTAVYSHGHIDHVFGVPVWERESAERGWPAPVVVAHRALPLRFDRYVLTAGYNQAINRRQFGMQDLVWPTEYRYPDRTYADRLDLVVGGSGFQLRHEKGETDDHTVTWQPDRRVLCCGDLFIWASPNAGNPQKVQRYPKEWAEALRRMVELRPEYLLPGHGLPVVGADRVHQALTDTADLLDSLVDQTLAVMNAGGRLDEALRTVRPPAHLVSRPYLRPVYDEPEFVVHNIWRLYGGWWDGNPSSLQPAPERALAGELAELAGGPGVLADRSLRLLAEAEAGGDGGGDGGGGGDEALRIAGHLAELAWLAAPDDEGIQRARHRVYSARADRATSTMARGVFRWAAGDSPGSPGGG